MKLIAASPSSLGAAPNTAVLEANYYWNLQGQGEAQLEFALEFPQELNQEEALVLLGFTGQAWEEIPALEASNSFRTESTIALSRYTAYALGNASLSTELTPAQAITPNGDGINDRWIIQKAQPTPTPKYGFLTAGASLLFRGELPKQLERNPQPTLHHPTRSRLFLSYRSRQRRNN